MDFSSKLNSICDSLLVGNQLIQFQSLSKLNGLIKEIKLYSGNNEVKFITKLIELMNKIDLKNLCMLIIDLVINSCKQNLVDTDVVINYFLSSINSNSINSGILLRGLTMLILSKKNKCYSLRNPTHPYILILRNSSENSETLNQLICQEIKFIYENNNQNEDPTTYLRSFYLHVFLDKFQIKHLIAKYLIKLPKLNENELFFIDLYISHLNDNEIRSPMFVETLNSMIGFFHDYKEENKAFVKIFYRIIKKVCFIDKHVYVDCSNIWNDLKLTLEKNQSLRNSLSENEILEILGESLYSISFISFKAFVEFTEYCLKTYNGKNKIYLAIFYPSLFNYLTCFGSNEIFFKKYQELVLQIIKCVNEKLKSIKEYSKPNEILLDLSYYLEENHLNYKKFNLLAADFLMDDSESCLQNAKILIEITRTWPQLSVTTIALYLLKIKISNNQNVLINIVKNFYELAINKNDINLFLKIITSIIDSAIMKNKQDYNYNAIQTVCFYQLTKLFTLPHYEKIVYPHLSRYVLTKSNKNMDMNSLYTKAYCINQVISYRPDYYTSQLLSTISDILSTYTSAESAGPCAILVDTLGYLCKSEIVEIKSTWSAIFPKYKDEKRILLQMAFCRFMSIAANLKHEAHQTFVEQILSILWSLIKCKDDELVNSAYESLSEFEVSLFKCSNIPQNILDKMKEKQKPILSLKENEEKSLDEIFVKVPASCYIDLFKETSCNAYEGMSKFLVKLLKTELDNIPKRVIYFNLEKQRTIEEQKDFHEKTFGSISSYLREEVKLTLKDLQSSKSIDNTFLLFAYDFFVEKDSSGKPTKRHKMMYWRNYEQTLTLILTKGKFQVDEKNLMLEIKAWKRFMENAYNACIQSLLVEYQMQIDDQPNISQADLQTLRDKIKNASIFARSKISLIISSCCTANLETQESSINDTAILALIGLINTSCKYCQLDNDKAMIKEQSKWIEALIDYSLNIHENSPTLKPSYNQTIFTNDLILFLQKIFKNTKIFELFLAEINSFSLQFNITSYLKDFIRNCQFDLIEKKSYATLNVLTFAYYINGIIKSAKEFSTELNKEINNLIKYLYDLFRTCLASSSKNTIDYFFALTICLCCLYDENSVFYDEQNLLQSLLVLQMNSNDNIETEMVCRVCLTCAAYKSNLIDNEVLVNLYKKLTEFENLKDLLAFYSRFLQAYGFYDSLKWIDEISKTWDKNLQNNKYDNEKEALNDISGLFSLIGGDCIHTTCILSDKALAFKSDLEKIVKPEIVIKHITNFIKQNRTHEVKKLLDLKFSIIYNTCSNFSSDNFYSIPSNYDYLDDYSILKEILNALFEICSLNDTNDIIEKRFETLVYVLKNGCESSVGKSLPPINWFYLMSSLMKSKCGKTSELNLIELTFRHTETLSSALGFLRNCLISLNSFSQFKIETQLFILNNLKVISKKFDPQLHFIFINKLKIYLSSIDSKNCDTIYYALLNGFNKCFSEPKSINTDIVKQLVQFFELFFNQYILTYNLNKDGLDKIVDLFMALNDDNLTDKLLTAKIDDQKNSVCKFFMISRIKFHLVSKSNQAIVFLNGLIDCTISNTKLFDEQSQNLFLNLFSNCIVNSYGNADQAKLNSLDLNYSNWLIEYMGFLQTILNSSTFSTENVDFSVKILTCFIYSMNIAVNKLKKTSESVPDPILYFKELSSSFKNLITRDVWKSIAIKIIDLVSHICVSKKVSKLFETLCEDFLLMLQRSMEFPSNIWFRYMQIVDKNTIAEI